MLLLFHAVHAEKGLFPKTMKEKANMHLNMLLLIEIGYLQ